MASKLVEDFQCLTTDIMKKISTLTAPQRVNIPYIELQSVEKPAVNFSAVITQVKT
jgi:hypothetical protein